MSSFTKPLVYKPTGSFDKWSLLPTYEILEEFAFDIGTRGSAFTVTVPKGFVTDFASIPWPLRLWFRPHDSRWSKAALIHDHVCRSSMYSRALADLLFLEGMHILGAGWRRWLFYSGVKFYGWYLYVFYNEPYYVSSNV